MESVILEIVETNRGHAVVRAHHISASPPIAAISSPKPKAVYGALELTIAQSRYFARPEDLIPHSIAASIESTTAAFSKFKFLY